MELLIESFTTLSSTGPRDVVPIRPVARSLVMIEMLAAIAYVAGVVSRIVGLMILHRRWRRARPGPPRWVVCGIRVRSTA